MKQILAGNVALALCAAFYLAWWVAAFKPAGSLRGLKSGWLLLPAVAAGIVAVVLICAAVARAPSEGMLFRPLVVAVCGAVVFASLVAITGGLMKRPVTAELFLIVGWATLSVCQVSALAAMGVYGRAGAIAFMVCIVALAALSLGCYMVYYKLDATKGWYDGMVPLVAVLVVAIVMDLTIIPKCL